MHRSLPIKNKFYHYQNYGHAFIESIEYLDKISSQDLEIIAEICNEDLIYSFLFKERLNEEKYSIKDAQEFRVWALQGWQNKEYFVFIIRNELGEVIGTCAIKSNNLDSAEIGYWMSGKAPGYMTNAVQELCKVAKEFGYKQLYALTKPENIKSQNVLLRAGFEFVGEQQRKIKDLVYCRFEKNL